MGVTFLLSPTPIYLTVARQLHVGDLLWHWQKLHSSTVVSSSIDKKSEKEGMTHRYHRDERDNTDIYTY